ncbi:FAD binding domain-containing protein [Thermotomaculum hydrothermale]|nr:FAD binding domain-containing protein [Thermotomaculum hydrothermale]
MAKEEIIFFLNGEKISFNIEKIKHFSLLDFLREDLKLTGSKKGCSEGDCGACTVVIGEYSPIEKRIVYKAITSCIYPVFKIEGKHIITIEGLAENGELNQIQKAFVDNHAIQCGFCTPGTIMSLLGLLLNNANPDNNEINKALSGNLCRCTGYKSIKNACKDITTKHFKKPEFIKKTEKDLKKNRRKGGKLIPKIPNSPIKKYIIPETLDEALSILEKEKCKIFNGCSDLLVRINKGEDFFERVIDISQLKELKFIHKENNKVKIGGNVTFQEFIDFARREKLNQLIEFFEFIGSKQIRNIGTIAGNVANASPIADSAVFLLATDANLTLRSKKGKRKVLLSKFYKNYKETELKQNELIESIEFEIPQGKVSYIKTSKRKEVDIASVNSCIIASIQNKKIKDVSISFGGVFPYPVRIYNAEELLKGKEINDETIEEAAKICARSVKPISDVRGSEEFRRKLVYNQVIKHFFTLRKGK